MQSSEIIMYMSVSGCNIHLGYTIQRQFSQKQIEISVPEMTNQICLKFKTKDSKLLLKALYKSRVCKHANTHS